MYWKDTSSAWGGKKVFLARSGQLRFRRFPSTPLLLTQQKETEFSNLFRVSFANLQKQGEIFLCSPASCWESSCQHAGVAANSSTQRDPKFSLLVPACYCSDVGREQDTLRVCAEMAEKGFIIILIITYAVKMNPVKTHNTLCDKPSLKQSRLR